MNISNGIIVSAQKVVLYGSEGIGKSTFASHFPNPVFIDTEGSTKKLNVKRMDKPTSWTMLCEQVKYIIVHPELCSTLIIDTIDWAEQLCVEHICSKANKKGIEDFGYGNGYVYEKEEIGRFLNLLDEVIAKNINVVLTAHAQLRKFEQPDELGAYDRWELKLGKKTSSQISPLIKEWADMVLFANYKTFAVAVDDQGKKHKAQGGQRVMYTTHHPCWDAKNRDGLPDEVPFDYSSIAHIIPDFKATSENITTVDKGDFEEIVDNTPQPQPSTAPSTEQVVSNPGIPKPLADLMQASGVTEKMLRETIALQGYFPESTPIENYPNDFISYLISIWDKVLESVKENNQLPF